MQSKEFDLFKGMNLTESQKKQVEEINQITNIVFAITKKRNELGLSQRDLALKVGIKQPVIARIEKLTVMPRIDTLIKICKCLGLAIEVNEEKNNPNIIKKQQQITLKNKFYFSFKNLKTHEKKEPMFYC